MYVGVDLSPGHSGVVVLNPDGSTHSYVSIEVIGTKASWNARMVMTDLIYGYVDQHFPGLTLVGLEDYALGPNDQHVSYQIAEVAGVLKYRWRGEGVPFALIHPRKRQSFAIRRRSVTKKDIIEWASQNGLDLRWKTRSDPTPQIRSVRGAEVIVIPHTAAFTSRPREDVSDAFVMAKMTQHIDQVAVPAYNSGQRSVKGDLFLDPDTGILNLPEALTNYSKRES